MTRARRRLLIGVLGVLVVGAALQGVSAWRHQRFLLDVEQRGIKVVPIDGDAVVLEDHSAGGLTVEDVNRLRLTQLFTIADFAKSRMTDSVIKALIEASADGAVGLRLSETQVTDAALDSSRFGRWMSYLDLSGSQISSASLPRIHRFHQFQLGYLSLANTKLGDEIFEVFSERVDIKGNPGGDCVTGPPVLNVTATKITADGVKAIRWSPHGLVLKDTAITDDAVSAMKLKELVYLDLTNTAVTDSSIVALSNLERLRVVRLDGTQITNDGLKQLNASCPQVCVIDRQPDSANARSRVVDAMCHGKLFGRIADDLWKDLESAGEWRSASWGALVSVGVADNVEEGHVVLGLRVKQSAKIVLTADMSVPCW